MRMVRMHTKFDGKSIIVPPELVGTEPQDVVIIAERSKKTNTSVWDVVGKAKHRRSGEELQSELNRLRDEWDKK